MPVHTFRAPSIREALQLIRRELGPEAVLLNTRVVKHRRRLPWRRATQETEITVGIATPGALPARRDGLAQSQQGAGPESINDSALATAASTATSTTTADDAVEIGGPTETVESLLVRLERVWQLSGREEIPDELFHVYTRLIDAEVDDDHARELVFQVKQRCHPEDLRDGSRLQRMLSEVLESRVACRGSIAVERERRKVVAFVGPTGVGKTTTVAKLAANFRLRDGVRLGLVTIDTCRAAAAEQLRTYADLHDVPMLVVDSPREMRRAMDEFAGLDLVLIDTAGRSPRDELKIQELKSFLSEAAVDEVHLVLSLTASSRSLQAAAERFSPVGASALLLTKLDEAPGLGAVLSAASRVGLPLSYFTTGQNVPEDIEAAHAARAVRLILSRDDLIQRR